LTGCWIDNQNSLPGGKRIFFAIILRTNLRTIHLPIKWTQGPLSWQQSSQLTICFHLAIQSRIHGDILPCLYMHTYGGAWAQW